MVNRKVDELGRVVLPAEYRMESGIEAGYEVSMTCEDGAIIITPAIHWCRLCLDGKVENEELKICNKCIKRIKAL